MFSGYATLSNGLSPVRSCVPADLADVTASGLNAITCPWRTREYAGAFGSPWEPLEVSAWRSFVLTRPIPGTNARDAIGCYPLAGFTPDGDIGSGLKQLKGSGLVSIALIPDPLSAPPLEDLTREFDLCWPYKTHYCIDQGRPPRQLPSHHKRKLRKSIGRLDISVVTLRQQLDSWCNLYDALIARRGISGIATFSRRFFEKIADHPAFTTFVGSHLGEVVAMAIWARSSKAAYYFLGASSSSGYRFSAAYAIMAAAIDYFRDVQWIHLGGGVGSDAGGDGLSFFKRGFANTGLTAFLCGAVLDPHRYAELSCAKRSTTWFPAYRGGDLPAARWS
jgi:hypothetical protein